MLGSALGQGLGLGIKKKLLSNAFQQARDVATNPESSPLDISLQTLQSLSGIPGSERYIGQILPFLLKQANQQRASQVGVPGGAQQGIAPPEQGAQGITRGGEAPQQQLSEQVTDQVTEQEGPLSQQFLEKASLETPLPPPSEDQSSLFEGTLNPITWGGGPVPSLYSPEQIQQVQSEDLAQGFEPIRAQRMQEYNELARKELGDLQKGAEIQAGLAQRKRAADESYRNVLGTVLNTNDPLKIALAENISAQDKYQGIANDVVRADKVKKEMDLVERNLSNFQKSSVRPNPYLPWSRSQYQNNFENLRKNAAPLVKYGMRPQIYQSLIENGWTQTESEQILNPLGTSLIEKITSLPRMPVEALTAGGGIANKEAFDKKRGNVLDTYEEFIKKSVKPGKVNPKIPDTLTPGTSLILLRNELMKKGANWEDITQIVQNLREKGEIKLDPYQENEMNTLIQRPINSLSLEEFFFGTKSL